MSKGLGCEFYGYTTKGEGGSKDFVAPSGSE